MKTLFRTALIFAAIGVLVYAAAYYASERLLYRTGDTNPFFKIETAEHDAYDWVILGASHAMPLDFADFNAHMEQETGLKILNLASPGTGPLYNRFVFEQFLSRRRTANLLYVLDSFAFASPAWNEDRFADAKLLARTPFRPEIAWRMAGYSFKEGVDPRAVLDYLTGFSKINNRDRFKRDVWEGEGQFERVHRPSAAATEKRIAYLYPDVAPDPAAVARYLQTFASLLDLAHRQGIGVVIVKMPVPARFYEQLPDEEAFDRRLLGLPAMRQALFRDFSLTMDEPGLYFDTDHLNRTGLTRFFDERLKAILTRE
ncbi:MAG: hypothetical protein Q8P46_07830 [Hyphomicrobiales bacterium]|nr:hypothetical protein [Hyphomicrobiales bacterium]